MENLDYNRLSWCVSDYAKSIGLNAEGLFRDSCSEAKEKLSFTISRKDKLRRGALVDAPKDSRLDFVIKSVLEEEADNYKKIADESGCDYFIKKNLAWDGFIQPSSGSLSLTPVEQVEYSLHEAYHRTEKFRTPARLTPTAIYHL